MAKVDDAVRDLIYYHAKRVAKDVIDELPDRVREMERELRDLQKSISSLREDVDELLEHKRQQMDVPPAPEEKVESSRVTKRTLRSIRKKFNLAQDELARLLEVSPATISQWERGESRPRSNNQARIITLREMEKEQVDEILDREDGRHRAGQKLKEIRERLNITQTKLAKLLGVSIASVRNWEAGEATPRQKNVERIKELEQTPEESIKEEVGVEESDEFDTSRLAELKNELNLTREQLAELLGVTANTVWNWETGRTTPFPENRKKIRELEQNPPDDIPEPTKRPGREFDGSRLTEFKKKHDLKQSELATLLDVSNATVWSWQTGRTTPTKKNIEKVEAAEEMSAEEVQQKLEGVTGEEESQDAEEEETVATE